MGIVASRLVERFYRPVFVLSEEDGEAQGSGRSIPPFHCWTRWNRCPIFSPVCGGHRRSAGLSMPAGMVGGFRQRLNSYARDHLTAADFIPRLPVDAVVDLKELTTGPAIEEILAMAPFGFGNPPPVLAILGAEVAEAPAVLKEKHLRVHLRQNGKNLFSKAWNFADRVPELTTGARVDAAFSIEEEPPIPKAVAGAGGLRYSKTSAGQVNTPPPRPRLPNRRQHTMRNTLLVGLGFLATMYVAQAGPPLICHPYNIGDAKSLPWGSGSNWDATDPSYNVHNLVHDTLAILDQNTTVLVRMETLRRAVLYGANDHAAARLLLSQLKERESGKPSASAYFDYGYFLSSLHQINWLYKEDLSAGIDGCGNSSRRRWPSIPIRRVPFRRRHHGRRYPAPALRSRRAPRESSCREERRTAGAESGHALPVSSIPPSAALRARVFPRKPLVAESPPLLRGMFAAVIA